MRCAYNKEYEEYICVDSLGELIRLNYVTRHFKVILKENGPHGIRFHVLRHSMPSLRQKIKKKFNLPKYKKAEILL